MGTKQPIWEFVANLGDDAGPVEYDGYILYQDKTGVYPPEMECTKRQLKQDVWHLYRIIIDQFKTVKRDNKEYLVSPLFDTEHSSHADLRMIDEWFNKDLDMVGQTCGVTADELRAKLCSDDIKERADAFVVIVDYFGFEEFDQYPIVITSREEMEDRYKDVR